MRQASGGAGATNTTSAESNRDLLAFVDQTEGRVPGYVDPKRVENNTLLGRQGAWRGAGRALSKLIKWAASTHVRRAVFVSNDRLPLLQGA
jgi:hypothetical protein